MINNLDHCASLAWNSRLSAAAAVRSYHPLFCPDSGQSIRARADVRQYISGPIDRMSAGCTLASCENIRLMLKLIEPFFICVASKFFEISHALYGDRTVTFIYCFITSGRNGYCLYIFHNHI